MTAGARLANQSELDFVDPRRARGAASASTARRSLAHAALRPLTRPAERLGPRAGCVLMPTQQFRHAPASCPRGRRVSTATNPGAPLRPPAPPSALRWCWLGAPARLTSLLHPPTAGPRLRRDKQQKSLIFTDAVYPTACGQHDNTTERSHTGVHTHMAAAAAAHAARAPRCRPPSKGTLAATTATAVRYLGAPLPRGRSLQRSAHSDGCLRRAPRPSVPGALLYRRPHFHTTPHCQPPAEHRNDPLSRAALAARRQPSTLSRPARRRRSGASRARRSDRCSAGRPPSESSRGRETLPRQASLARALRRRHHAAAQARSG